MYPTNRAGARQLDWNSLDLECDKKCFPVRGNPASQHTVSLGIFGLPGPQKYVK